MGGGEVSAEEVDEDNKPAKAGIKSGVASKAGACEFCHATGKFHRPDCPNNS